MKAPHRASDEHLLGEGVSTASIPGHCSLGLYPLAVDDVLAMLCTKASVVRHEPRLACHPEHQ